VRVSSQQHHKISLSNLTLSGVNLGFVTNKKVFIAPPCESDFFAMTEVCQKAFRIVGKKAASVSEGRF
jgi:hypothetical protein